MSAVHLLAEAVTWPESVMYIGVALAFAIGCWAFH